MPKKTEIKMSRQQLVGKMFDLVEISDRHVMLQEQSLDGRIGTRFLIDVVDSDDGYGAELEISRLVPERLG